MKDFRVACVVARQDGSRDVWIERLYEISAHGAGGNERK